jgi:hypothetical protein
MTRFILSVLMVLFILGGIGTGAFVVILVHTLGANDSAAFAAGVIVAAGSWIWAIVFGIILGAVESIGELRDRVLDLEESAWPASAGGEA